MDAISIGLFIGGCLLRYVASARLGTGIDRRKSVPQVARQKLLQNKRPEKEMDSKEDSATPLDKHAPS